MTFADDTKFTIPEGAKLSPDVKEGATVVDSYKEEAGKKVPDQDRGAAALRITSHGAPAGPPQR